MTCVLRCPSHWIIGSFLPPLTPLRRPPLNLLLPCLLGQLRHLLHLRGGILRLVAPAPIAPGG